MLWKRHFFELEDDETDISLERLYLFAQAAVYTCTVNDDKYHLNRSIGGYVNGSILTYFFHNQVYSPVNPSAITIDSQ